MAWLSRLVNVFRRDRLTADIDEELQSHVQDAIEAGRDPLGAISIASLLAAAPPVVRALQIDPQVMLRVE